MLILRDIKLEGENPSVLLGWRVLTLEMKCPLCMQPGKQSYFTLFKLHSLLLHYIIKYWTANIIHLRSVNHNKYWRMIIYGKNNKNTTNITYVDSLLRLLIIHKIDEHLCSKKVGKRLKIPQKISENLSLSGTYLDLWVLKLCATETLRGNGTLWKD